MLITKKIRFSLLLLLMVTVACLTSGFMFWDSAPPTADNAAAYDQAYESFQKNNYLTTIDILHNLNTGERSLLSGKILFLLGKSYSNLGYTGYAIKYLSRAREQDMPLQDAILYEMAQAYFRGNELSKAIEHYNQMITLFPESPFLAKATFELGELYYIQQDYGRAYTSYQSYLSRFSNGHKKDIAMLRIGSIYEQQSEYQKAYAFYEKILASMPDTTCKYDIRVRMNNIIDQLPGKSAAPEAEDLYTGAVYLRNDNRFSESNDLLKEMTENSPTSSLISDAYYMLALNYYSCFDNDKAIQTFKNFYKKFPDNKFADDTHFYIAKIYERLDKPKQAAKEYKLITSSYPNGDMAASAYYNLANINIENGSWPTAITYLNKLVENYAGSSLADDALWKVGFYYYSLSKYQAAQKTFSTALLLPQKGDNSARCVYWAAKSAGKTRQYDKAQELYNILLAEYPSTFYAFRAYENLVKLTDEKQAQRTWALAGLRQDAIEQIHTNDSINRIKLLTEFRYKEEARTEIYTVGNKEKTFPGLQIKLLLCELAIDPDDYYQRIHEIEFALSQSSQSNQKQMIPQKAMEHAYPKGFWPLIGECSSRYGIDPYLIMALIREESRFNPDAKSCSNAMGLMQIMPFTGKDIARQLRMVDFTPSKLYEPETNILMGTYYFSQLISRFNQDAVLALAGYNGGPNNAKKWHKQFYSQDIDVFIENIPFTETRQYIKKVLTSYWMYKMIYG